MTRDIHASVVTASGQAVVEAVVMVALDFSSGFVRAHTGVGTITYGGNDFIGLGNLGTISAVNESLELEAYSIDLVLSGVDPDNISVALGEDYQGRDATMYFALLNPDTGALIGDPVVIFKGLMDTMSIRLGDTAAVTVTVQSDLARWSKPNVRRMNDADQQAKYPGDKGLQFVEDTVRKQVEWAG